MSEDIQHEVAMFNAARQLAGAARAAYLDQACAGQAVLRRKLEELLRAGETDGEFLEKPAHADSHFSFRVSDASHHSTLPSEKIGDRIGSYKLLQQIGEGGCGVVYLAEQEQPIRRRVALKIIKLGMDTKQVIARFDAERQTLALMDHPNIAKVLDAGATETGRPYFVMELVTGVRITEFCDGESLTTPQRLDLFMQVCNAIQHAHQKGIIHRDIKPSNVLVTVNDGVAIPKVIDFGIAKATQGRLTDQTLFTVIGQFMGTPAYMSPEQAVLTSLDIDTRSDIYSLGVLLYELLTGQTPFDAKKLLEAGWEEMRRTIREQEPARPSTKLGAMAAGELVTAARRRGSEPPKLIHLVRGDLDWIVMKCLEKNRARRYETAVGLARDVERYRKNEAISARPPGNWYRFQKLIRRHRLAFSAAFVVTLSLIICLIVSVFSAIRLEEARGQTQLAKNDAVEKLWASYLAESRARRASGQAGRRFGSLEALTNAAAIHPNLAVRNEVIAALALSDLRVSRLSDFKWTGPDEVAKFDSTLERYAVGEPDGTITIHAADTGHTLVTLPSTGKGVALLAFCEDLRFLKASYTQLPQDSDTWLWDIGRQTPALKALAGGWSSEISPDGLLFASTNPDGTASIYNLSTHREIKRLALGYEFRSLKFDPSQTRLAASRIDDSLVNIYQIESGRCLLSLTNAAPLSAVTSWSPDGKILAIPCEDNKVYLMDAQTGQLAAKLEGHAGRITQAAFSHSGDVLATTSWDDTIRLWDSTTGAQIVRMSGGARGFNFSADDRHLGAILEGPLFGLAEVAVSQEYRGLRTKAISPGYGSPVFSPDGCLMATGGDPHVCIWNVASGKELGSFATGAGDTLLFLPDGTGLITTERSGGVYLRPLRLTVQSQTNAFVLGKPLKIADCKDPRTGVLSPDGRLLAIPGFGPGTITLIDLKNQQAGGVLSGDGGVDYVALSPDGQFIVSGSWQHSGLRIWNVSSKKLEKTLATETRARPLFSPDGRWLAIISNDYQFLDARSWKTNGPPIAGSNWMQFNDLAFSPDSRLVALVQSSHRIQLLESVSRRELATLDSPDQTTIAKLTFSPDGACLAALGQDKQLRLWDLRLIRQELKGMNLDWDLPPFPPVEPTSPKNITLQIEE